MPEEQITQGRVNLCDSSSIKGNIRLLHKESRRCQMLHSWPGSRVVGTRFHHRKIKQFLDMDIAVLGEHCEGA